MRYRVTLRQNHYCYLAVAFMALAVVLRLFHFIPRWDETDIFMLVTQFFLPLLASIPFFYGALAKGGKMYLVTLLSVFLGVLFFIIKAQDFAALWHTVLCTMLYTLVFMLYTLTGLGVLGSLLPQKLVFALPLLFHICQDLFFPEADFAATPLPELSVLCIMASLLAITWALKLEKNENNNNS